MFRNRWLLFCLGLASLGLLLGTPRRASWAVEISPEAFAQADQLIRDFVTAEKTAGVSFAVVHDGHLALEGGHGFADRENDVRANAETVYRLGSITKQFTATAIMQLVEQGKLSLDDELTKFLPDFPTTEQHVKIQHLLNHTSGIKSYTSLKSFWDRVRDDMSHEELLQLFQNEPVEFAPGEKWSYNNSGYYLLGMIIEKVSDRTYEQYLQEHIFGPLHMRATRYGDMQAIIPRRAQGYALRDGKLVNASPMSMNMPGAAGGLVSSVLDLARWVQALDDQKLLSSASLASMYEPTRLNDSTVQPYGYGWALGQLESHRTIGHGGGIHGFSTQITRYPDVHLAIIVLCNCEQANASQLEVSLARVLLGIPEPEVLDLPLEEALAQSIAGDYQLGEAALRITAVEGRLFVEPTGQPRERLKWQGETKFVLAETPGVRVTFDMQDGRVTGFTLETDGQRLVGKRVE